MRYNLLFHILLFSLTSYTQNLVKNPSFEEYNIINDNPCSASMALPLSLLDVKNWEQLTQSLVLYIHNCSSSSNSYRRSPYAGNAYISLIVYFHTQPSIHYTQMSYAQGKLKSTLIKDQLYCVSYNTSLRKGSKIAIQNVDLYFSDTALPILPYRKLLDEYTPQIKSPRILRDSIGWDKVETVYKAKGSEKYLVIGNFNDEQNTNTTPIPSSTNILYSTYYVDDVSVVPLNVNKPDLGSDTLLCNSDFPYVLRAPKGYDSYLWNDNSTADTLVVYSEGNYKVNCYLDGCGELTDSIHIDIYESNDLVTFDTTLCKDDSLVLSSPYSFDTYNWSTNSTDTSIVVNNAGTYLLTVNDQCRKQVDSFKVTMDSVEVLQMNIKTDTNICNEESMANDLIQLYSLNKQQNYRWSNGATSDTININSGGNYWFETKFNCGISKSNSITVEACPLKETKIFVPNVFSPNGDGINDIFQPEGENFQFLQMQIFNRWGEQVYRTNTPYWDGRIKGKKAQQGVYFYLISYKDAIGEQKQLKGTVSVVY